LTTFLCGEINKQVTTPPDLAVLRQSIQQDPLGARAQIDALLAHEPDSIALIEARILTQLRCNDMAEVVEAAQRALSRHRTLNLYFWLGGALLHLGRPREALAPLGEAVGLGANPATLDTLARCQHRLGMIDAAIATLRHAISLPAEGVTPFYASLRGLAYALRDAGRWQESERVIQDLLMRFSAQPARVASMALHFDIILAYPGWNRFLDKARLAEAFGAFHARRPDDPVFWPETFRLPQEHVALADWYAANPGAILAIKPNDLFGGRGITVTRALPPEDASGCVAQRYVDPPALIEGHKFHIRLYILITSAAPTRAWLWGEGIVRLAPELYATDDAALARPAAHITNTALHIGHPALHVADDASAEDVGHVRALGAVLRRLYPQPEARAQAWDDLRMLARRFIACVAESGVFVAQAREHPRWSFPPMLFALDVLVDRDGRPWLLEVQRNPSMTGSPLLNRLNAELFRAAFRLGVHHLLDTPMADPAPLSDPAALERIALTKETESAAGFERIA
jgi:tetratricopeptide (TPR) repeat protein